VTEVDKIPVKRKQLIILSVFQKLPPPTPASGGHYSLRTINTCNYDTVSPPGWWL